MKKTVLETPELQAIDFTFSNIISGLMPYRFKRGEQIPVQRAVLWQIELGIVRTITYDHEGKLIALGIWGTGDLIGEPLSHVEPYEIQCLTDVKIRLIPSSLWYQVFDAMLCHVQQAEELLSILHTNPTVLRLRLILHWLADKFGEDVELGRSIGIKITHQEISELIRTTRVTVTRLVKQLEEQGIIANYRGHFVILW